MTTAASGDVKRQALVFFLSLGKEPHLCGCGLLGIGPKNYPGLDCLYRLVLVALAPLFVADNLLSSFGWCVLSSSVALLGGPRDVAILGWTFAIGHGRKC